MNFFGSKKNAFPKNPSTLDSFGKTEPIGGTVQTEPVPGKVTKGDLGKIGGTLPVNGGIGLVNIDPAEDPSPYPVNGPTERVPIVPMQDSDVQPVVGWLVCIKGANFGKEFRIHSENNYVGRETGDIVIYGDFKISRQNHMNITFEPKYRHFYLSNGTASNSIYLNDSTMPVLSPVELHDYDIITTGDTSLIFIGLCGEKFGWEKI